MISPSQTGEIMFVASISGVSILGISTLAGWGIALVGVLLAFKLLLMCLGVRMIPNDRVGIVEKIWSGKGSVGQGRIIALSGQAGFEATLLRGGMHFFKWPIQYRVHKVPLVTIPQGKIGYVYARDGEPLQPSQTLGRVVNSDNFQDAEAFLARKGQRGR